MTAIKPRSEEWYALRRDAVTSTDIPIILGLSPYRSEASLAREKQGQPDEEAPDARRERMLRLGLQLEEITRGEDEIEHGIKLRRVNRVLSHPTLPWARTSLDFERVGQRVIVEAKSTRAGRWDDGLPQDVEAQVRWQMGVANYPAAHVAVLRHGSELVCFDVEHDADTFDGLVTIAEDFRRRLADGGPFAENAASVKARWPADAGTEMDADADLTAAVHTLLALRERSKALAADEEAIETAIKTRMADTAVLRGADFRVTWKRTKDREETDWKSLATGLLTTLPEPERSALVSIQTTVRPGFRPFRVSLTKENE
jgi:putative phage-type endonuclease